MGTHAMHPALRRGDEMRCTSRFGFVPRVAGVPVLPPDANERQWLDARRPMVTASEVAAVLGRSTHSSPFSLWWQKQPDWPGTPMTVNMHIGRKLEAVIGELWSELHPEAALYRPGAALWAHPVEEWLGATPDYLSIWPVLSADVPDSISTIAAVHGRDPRLRGVRVEPVECKSDEGGPGWGTPGTGEIPEHHLCQVLTQCITLGVPRGHLIRLAGKRITEYVVDVQEHGDLVAEIITKGRAFHASLHAGVAPEIDEHAATARTLVDLYPGFQEGTSTVVPDTLADQWRAAKQAVKDAKALEDHAGNRIREILGKAEAQYAETADGRRIAARSHYKRRGYVVAPTEVDQLREVK